MHRRECRERKLIKMCVCKCIRCAEVELGDGLPEYCSNCYRQAKIDGIQRTIRICDEYIGLYEQDVNNMDACLAIMSLRASLADAVLAAY